MRSTATAATKHGHGLAPFRSRMLRVRLCLAVSYAFTRSTNATQSGAEHCFEDKQAVMASELRCASELKCGARRIDEFECPFVRDQAEDL